MKVINNLLVALLLLSSYIAQAGGPEPVYSFVKQLKPFGWYQEQARAWRNVIDQNPQNANAWWNYYSACRIQHRVPAEKLSTPLPDLEALVAEMEGAIPNTYEYHLIKSVYMVDDPNAQEKHLFAAYEMDPNRPEIYSKLYLHYELEHEQVEKQKLARKWFRSNDLSSGMLAWNYNVLMSLEQDAVILTNGDNDTYPLWILQEAQQLRPDVTVINIPLMASYPKYASTLVAETGSAALPSAFETAEGREAKGRAAIMHLVGSSNRPIYLGIAVEKTYRELLEGNLYITGLALRYSPTRFDNVGIIKQNFENRFVIDYLNHQFQTDLSQDIVDQMNLNYLPSLFILYESYQKGGEAVKALKLKSLIQSIADAGNRSEDIAAYFETLEKSNEEESNRVSVNAKTMERQFMHIKDKLYAGMAEVSNEAYELFLTDLLKQRRYEELGNYRSERTDWRSLLPPDRKAMTDADLFAHAHPDDPDSPVQNISYEAAKAYCVWLTERYNSAKKRKYQQVQFRLPTEKEWEFAALGNLKGPYPWGGPFPRNSRGCYLGNYRTMEGIDHDGGVFPVPMVSYSPNDYGLYCMSGNVSEMTEKPGIAKGGNWDTRPENSTVTSMQEYDGPNPRIGFRVFMDVLVE